jgi:hypothetical protein
MAAMAVLLGACASNSPNPTQYLDEKTAATVSVVARPLLFAHERPESAAHSRDYITLTAAAVNHTGRIDCFIFAYIWSTLDRRNANSTPAAPDELSIAADDRRIQPQLEGHSPLEAGVGTAIGAPPGGHWRLNVYRSDVATLHYLAEARHIAVLIPSPEGPLTYEPWNNGQGPLKALVQRLEVLD